MSRPVRTILHVDMDAFFASIEQRDRPALRGRPVVVGAPPDRRGVVAAASYEARRYGIHSAMPSRTAGALCPHAIFVPVDMDKYVAVSEQLMAILESVTPRVESLSVDEAFLDVTGVLHAWPDAVHLARHVKARIRDELQLTASIGVAPNLFLAKLASGMEKPDGLTVTPFEPEAVRAFLAPLPVESLWGVGEKTAGRLRAVGIRLAADLQQLESSFLARALGSAAAANHLLDVARGVDEREVQTEHETKSLSAEHTFDEDSADPAEWRRILVEQMERVGRRLRRHGLVASTAFIKVRLGDFSTFTRQAALPALTQSDHDLVSSGLALFEAHAPQRPIRLLGFGVSGLRSAQDAEAASQPLLFPEMDPAVRARHHREVDEVVDQVRERFGRGALRRGATVRSRRPRSDPP